jgi:hypothetical protein
VRAPYKINQNKILNSISSEHNVNGLNSSQVIKKKKTLWVTIATCCKSCISLMLFFILYYLMYSWFQISSYGLSMVNFIKLNYNYEIRSKRTNRKKKDMNKKKSLKDPIKKYKWKKNWDGKIRIWMAQEKRCK